MFFRKRTNSRNRRREHGSTIRRQVFFGVLTTSIISLVCVAVWYATRLPAFTISNVLVQGGETIPHGDVERAAQSALSGTYLKLVPHRFSFFYPKDALAAAVASIARVRDVQVNREGTILHVNFTEYVPFALWCSEADVTPRCYFLDEHAYAFAPGPSLQGGALVRHTREGSEALEKGQVFDTESFRALHNFLDRLTRERGLRVTDVYYTDDGDVRLNINGGGALMIRAGESYDTIFENLTSVLASKAFVHLAPGNFQYIDLRFGNKVFVNEEPLHVGTSTEATTTELMVEEE